MEKRLCCSVLRQDKIRRWNQASRIKRLAFISFSPLLIHYPFSFLCGYLCDIWITPNLTTKGERADEFVRTLNATGWTVLGFETAICCLKINLDSKYLRNMINVIALKFPSILCPVKNKPTVLFVFALA